MDSRIYNRLKQITEEEWEILKGRSEIDKGRYMTIAAPGAEIARSGVTGGTVSGGASTGGASTGAAASKKNIPLDLDSKRLLDSGKLIQIRPHTRFIHFPRHTHNYVEVLYMCSGQTVHIVNGDKVILKQGELLFLSQKAVQEIYPASEEDVGVNFIILPEFFDQALYMIGAEDNLLRKFIVGCLRGAESDIGYLHFKVADVLPIQNLVENLIWTILNNQQNKRSINQFTMGLLFLQLINYTDKVEVGKDHFDQELILSVYRFVEERYKDGELSELAKLLGFDLYWLSSRIKKLTGQTYTELVQTKRLSQAQFLLQNTNLAVADIGRAVGYDNLSYFHRIFREKFGDSPKQYRTTIPK